MRNVTRALALLLAACLSLACDSTLEKGEQSGGGDVDDRWEDTTPTPGSPGKLDGLFGRKGRRLSVDQLQQSLPKLFSGITWTVGMGTTPAQKRNNFDRLAQTLGRPDYVQLNQENRDVSSLFMKFIDDMAGQVCKKAIAADEALPDDQRSVIRYPDDVDKTLRWLRLKFHAIEVPAGETEGIRDLRRLYDGMLSNGASRAWEAVCFALLTAPEFYIY